MSLDALAKYHLVTYGPAPHFIDGTPPTLTSAFRDGNVRLILEERSLEYLAAVIEAIKAKESIDALLPGPGIRSGLIHYVVGHRFFEGLCLLLDEGADVNLPDSGGQTALHGTMLGVERTRGPSWREFAELLVDRGANLEACDHSGSSALSLAIDGVDVEKVTYLCNAGVSLDKLIKGVKSIEYVFENWRGQRTWPPLVTDEYEFKVTKILATLLQHGAEIPEVNLAHKALFEESVLKPLTWREFVLKNHAWHARRDAIAYMDWAEHDRLSVKK